jgi:hypothetical protein
VCPDVRPAPSLAFPASIKGDGRCVRALVRLALLPLYAAGGYVEHGGCVRTLGRLPLSLFLRLSRAMGGVSGR